MPDCDENMALRYVMQKKFLDAHTTGDVIGAARQHHKY